jgi:hypothetical protein
LRRGAEAFKRGETLYYAQVKTPKGKPPTARIVEATFYGAGRRVGEFRLNVSHAKFPIDADHRWCDRNPDVALALLWQRIQHAIKAHEYQIDQLLHAGAHLQNSVMIIWPEKELPPLTRSLTRGRVIRGG